jgi:putative endonuclease
MTRRHPERSRRACHPERSRRACHPERSRRACHPERSRRVTYINLNSPLMKSLYVYILKCADNSYYTGVTNSIDRRLIEHNEGYKVECYTFSRRPVTLVYFQICNSPQQAIELEKKIKGWSRAKKEALISENWKKLHELAICNNLTSHKNSTKPS